MEGLNKEAMQRAREKWDRVAKPLGSLGILEDICVQLAGIYGSEDFSLDKKCVAVFCADNGVVCEGVTQCSSDVTAAVARNLVQGRTSVCLMAEVAGAAVLPVDAGMNTEVEGLLSIKSRRGSENIACKAAMTRAEFDSVFSAAERLVLRLKEEGIGMIVTGEMGIGNTTTAAAVICALLGESPADITGRGSGLTDEGLRRKTEVIMQALKTNRPPKNDAAEVIRRVGGFDIAAMAGVFSGGAKYRVPIVIDGVISAAAALAASKITPACLDFMIASHVSAEPAAEKVLAALGKYAPIRAGLRLGEGTGGVALLPLLDMTLSVYNSAATFDSSGIEQYEHLS